MGWWWTSPTPSPEKTRPPESDAQNGQPSFSQPAEFFPVEPEVPFTPPRQLTHDEQAEVDLQLLIAELQHAEELDRPSKLPPNPFRSPAVSPQPSSQTDQNPLPSSIDPDTLYPTSMSCRQAFDYAFFCQSLGGQWVNVYRYGELRSCSEHWDNFWLCMRSRSYKEAEKKKMISNHYRKKQVKYKTGPSSEDVWELRKQPVEGAFEGDFAALERWEQEQKEKRKLESMEDIS